MSDLLRFMASRFFVHINRQSTVGGYSTAMNFFHKMFAGWALPMSHCMIAGLGKGIDRAHGMSKKKAQIRLPLSWSLTSQGRQALVSMEDGGRAMWLGFAVSYFMLCRAPEMWAYADGKVHPDFCLTRECLTFSREGVQVEFRNRSTATAVQIRFVASKCDQKRVHVCAYAVVQREGDGGSVDGGLRSSAGIARRASPAPKGGAADSPGHVARLESFH